MIRTLTVAAVLGIALALQPVAQAQIVIVDPFTGQRTIILPSRLQPGANIPIPGTGQFWVNPFTGTSGYQYLGLDGLPHGQINITNPVTGQQDRVVYSTRTGQNNQTQQHKVTVFQPRR